MNGLKQIFDDRNINVSAFARANGITPTTLYNVLNSSTLGRTGVDVWLKIAKGLDTTAESLYQAVSGRDLNEG